MDSFGEFLRRERELRHIELNEIAKITRIKKAYLQAIETDNYDELPDAAFVKGFIRAYCNYIGLDPDKTVNYFQQFYDEKFKEAPQPQKKRFYNRENRQRLFITVVLGLAAASVVGLAVYYSIMGSIGGTPPQGSEKEIQEPVFTGTVTEQPAKQQAAEITTTTVLPITSSGAFTQPAKLHTLLLKATEDTWVRLVQNNEEGTAQEALLNPGDAVSWKFTGTAMLIVGNAEGLNVILDNKQVEHNRIKSEVIRLKLPH